MTDAPADLYLFDADNHYYEAEDAFTRYVPEDMQPRCVQWVEMDGRKYHLVGGKLVHAVVNPTWNPIAKPGALKEYFQGNPNRVNPADLLKDREPTPAYYLDRDARLAKMEAQGLQGAWLFPTLGVLYEAQLDQDVEAAKAYMRGFNRWLHDDWGFAYKNKIFAAPYISLVDIDAAVDELEWALERDARTIVMRPGPAWNVDGYQSPFDTRFDPFWARVNEAGITVVVHASDVKRGNQRYGSVASRAVNFKTHATKRPTLQVFENEDGAHDYFLTMCLERLFERFPRLRFASVELGAGFLPTLVRKLDLQARKTVNWFQEDPVELFKEHVWINPFFEDDPNEVVDIMGPDRVIFGSDWPHVEGMTEPSEYLLELKGFEPEVIEKIMGANTLALNTRRPT